MRRFTAPHITAWLVALGLCLTSASLLAQSDDAEDPSAEEIIDEALKRNALGFDSGRAEVSLLIETDEGDRRERVMTIRSRDVDDQRRTLVELTEPADLKGQSFLFARHEQGADDIWMYVPAFSVTRRIEGSKKQGAFLGSHFTYADLESRQLREGSYTKLDDEEVGGHACHVIRASADDSDDSQYGKVVAYVRQSDDIPMKIEFFNQDGQPLKTLYTQKISTTDDGTTYIEQMTMKSADGGYSRLHLKSFKQKIDSPASAFTKDQLGK
jgi:outer membrane lipoprotein-sorting protein